MYESPVKLSDWKIEVSPFDQEIKNAAVSIDEQFDRYILSGIAKAGITVDREELLKAMQYDRDQYNKGYKDGVKDGIKIGTPKWIPVTERLPEEYKNVLCYYEYFRYGDFNCMFRTIDRGYYGNGGWGGEAGQGYKNKVLAWMPLPKPPKDGEI